MSVLTSCCWLRPLLLAIVLNLSALADRAAAAAEESPESCDELALRAVPRDKAARAALLRELAGARERCLAHPAFLATLGGALLDDGDIEHALLWLERALLLDPNLLGARADLALALAAGGDRHALDELVREWGSRTDVPPALVERLAQAVVAGSPASRWAVSREMTVLAGYESNLNQSPRLAELTITPPGGGPIDLPLLQALKPRPGGALLADGAVQAGYRQGDSAWWLAGVSAVGRVAPGNAETGWHLVQAAASYVLTGQPWRLRFAAAELWYGGSLADPYRLDRFAVTFELDARGCLNRAQVEAERRRYAQVSVGDGRLRGLQVSVQCALDASSRWLGSVSGRYGTDEPTDGRRAGGEQIRWSLGLRLQGRIAAQRTLDLGLRYGEIRDAEGYSPLLQNNAPRRQRQLQTAAELTQALGHANSGRPVLAVLQVQGLRQRSNIRLFSYDSLSVYSGLRWQW